MTDLSIVGILITLIVTAIIGVMKYMERKYGTNPEAWDYSKFLLLLAVSFIVMVLMYVLQGIIEFPGEQVIAMALMVFGAAYTLITGGKVVTNVIAPAATAKRPGYELPRDGSILQQGKDGWYVRINPSPEAATLPDDKCYQLVSPSGWFTSGNKDTIIYLATSEDAAGYRKRYVNGF
jgi:hypothetical protein